MVLNARKNREEQERNLAKPSDDMRNRYAVHAVGTSPSPQFIRAVCKHGARWHDARRSRGKYMNTRRVYVGIVHDEWIDGSPWQHDFSLTESKQFCSASGLKTTEYCVGGLWILYLVRCCRDLTVHFTTRPRRLRRRLKGREKDDENREQTTWRSPAYASSSITPRIRMRQCRRQSPKHSQLRHIRRQILSFTLLPTCQWEGSASPRISLETRNKMIMMINVEKDKITIIKAEEYDKDGGKDD